MKLKVTIGFLLLFLVIEINSQSWTSSNILQGNNNLSEISSSTDVNNNIYTLGFFTSNITSGTTELTTYGSRDYFVSKFNQTGELDWLRQLGGSSLEYVGGGLCTCEEGYLYVTGGFQNDLYYNPADFISSGGGFDIFITKYDILGNVIWCKNVGTGAKSQRSETIIINNNELIITGFFTDSITLDNDTTLYSTDGFDDFFYSSFDTDGNHNWTKQIKGLSSVQYGSIYSVIPTTDSYLMSGIFADSIVLENDTIVSLNEGYDIVLFETNLTGNVLWHRTIGSEGLDYSFSSIKDPDGNIYIGGYYGGSILSAQSNETEYTTIEENNGETDLLIIKYDSEGTLQWMRTAGGIGVDKIFDIDFFDDKIHVSGLFIDKLSWGGIELITNGIGDQDMFYGSLDLNGNYRSANSYKGRNNSSEEAKAIFYSDESLLTVIRSNSDLLVLGDSLYTNPSQNYFIAVGAIGCLPINITTSKTNVTSCYGDETGTIFVGASGGFGGPFKYSIDNGDTYQDNDPNFLSVAGGEYNTVVVDKENCAQAGPTVTITQPDEIIISNVESDNVLCNGDNGSITVEGTGGTGSLLFSTDNGATFPNAIGSTADLPAGNYNVVVKDANSCEVAGPAVEITQPDALEITGVEKTNLVCFEDEGGAITINAAGGTTPYNYSIDGGTTYQEEAAFSGLAAGTYSIKVTDEKNCEITGAGVNITQPDELIVTVDNTTNPLCNGNEDGTITLSATGGSAPYEFSIDSLETQSSNTDYTGLKAGMYDIFVVDDSGCIGTAGKTEITQPDTLKIILVSVTNITSTVDGEIVLEASGGTEPYTFTQQPEGISQSTGTFTFGPGEDGVYSFELQDANNCGPDVKLVQIYDLTNITEQMLKEGVIYPNPSSGQITIEMRTEKHELLMEVITINGKMMLQKKVFSEGGRINETLDLSNLPKGIYMIRMDNKPLSSGVILE